VRILEVDAERRRLSLSLKRVDEGMPTQPLPGEDAAPPTIDLSEDVFSDEAAPAPPLAESSDEADEAEEADEPEEPEEADEADEPEASVEPAEGSDEPVPAE
jgi:small subunit ribosomal protein S1